MDKKELRSYYKKERNKLQPVDREKASQSIAKQLFSKWRLKDEIVSIFLPIEHLSEVNTQPIIDQLSKKNKLCAPVSDFITHQMKHVELSSNTIIEKNEWGIPEPLEGKTFLPEQITLVFVPLLISDLQGNRLGYGKGFYDRFLNQCTPGTLFIGLNFFPPIPSLPEVNEFDVPLDYIVTPDKIFKNGRS
jgi:5-formyltetrahydrofolate cyclo-ligase